MEKKLLLMVRSKDWKWQRGKNEIGKRNDPIICEYSVQRRYQIVRIVKTEGTDITSHFIDMYNIVSVSLQIDVL